MKGVCLFFVIAILISCKKNADETTASKSMGNIESIDFDSLQIEVPQLIDSIKYIALETTNDCLLGDIKKLDVWNKNIFIEDSNDNIFVFDEDGRFMVKIGTKGRGPEEYMSALSFILDKEKKLIGILDVMNSKVIYYDFSGKFVKNVRTPLWMANYVIESVWYQDNLINYYACSPRVIYSVGIYDKNMKLNMNVNPYPMNRCETTLWTTHPLAETKEGVSFIQPLSDTIYQFNGHSAIPRYLLKQSLPLVTAEKFDSYNREVSRDVTYLDFIRFAGSKNYFQGISEIYETRHYLLMEVMEGLHTFAHILWNKQEKKGYFAGTKSKMRFDKGKDIYRPFFNHVVSSNDEVFVGMYNDFDIEVFKSREKRGLQIDPAIRKIAREWNEENNPVIALYYLKTN